MEIFKRMLTTTKLICKHVTCLQIKGMSYKYIIVLDFEATCWDGEFDSQKKAGDVNEIIEFPSVVIDISVNPPKIVDEIQQFVKPAYNPKLSNFCKKLTSITQQQVDSGKSFAVAFKDHREFVKKYPESIFLTVGDWDLNWMLPSDAEYNNQTIPSHYKKWINIKTSFSEFFKCKPTGMAQMLKYLGLRLDGFHHRGIDDCKNTAKIAIEMIRRGWKPVCTNQ